MAPWPTPSRSVVVGLALVLGLAGPAAADRPPAALQRLMHDEQQLLSREVNEERVISPRDNQQRAEFSPEAGRTFAVKSYWVDAAKMHAFSGTAIEPALATMLSRTVRGRPQVRLIVHPESEAFYADLLRGATRADDLHAQATASSRTLLVWRSGHADQAFFAKLSLDAEIGGVRRTIPAGETARSIGISDTLAMERDLPDSFGYLPEVFSAIPRGMERGGMIIRAIPPEIRSGQVRVVPLFSLYAEPRDGSRPLLVEMIRRSGLTPERFIRERILRPFTRQWAELVVEHGITSEPHAQNVLIVVGADGLPTGRFYHRDFGGFNVDFAHRAALGRPVPATLPTVGGMDADYFTAEHEETWKHLEAYFGQGFVYNLDAKVAGWQRRGLLRRSRRLGRRTSFLDVLRHETERAFAQVSGRARRLRSLDDVPALTGAGRRSVRGDRSARGWIRQLSVGRGPARAPRPGGPLRSSPRLRGWRR